jgi:hypothetical protein
MSLNSECDSRLREGECMSSPEIGLHKCHKKYISYFLKNLSDLALFSL